MSVLILVVSFFGSTETSWANEAKVSVETPLRLFPDEASEVVAIVASGKSVTVLQEAGDWSLVQVETAPAITQRAG